MRPRGSSSRRCCAAPSSEPPLKSCWPPCRRSTACPWRNTPTGSSPSGASARRRPTTASSSSSRRPTTACASRWATASRGSCPTAWPERSIRTSFTPRFRENNYRAGISDGMRRIVAVVEARHVLTAAERARLGPRAPNPWELLPFYALAVALGAFVLGVGVQTRTLFATVLALPVLIAPAFIGARLFLVPAAATLLPVGVAAFTLGFRAGRRRSWRTTLRGRDEALTSRWVAGGGDPPPPASGTGSGGSPSGGSSSGGSSGRELRRRAVGGRRRQRDGGRATGAGFVRRAGCAGRARHVSRARRPGGPRFARGDYANAQRNASRAIASGTSWRPSNSS